MEQDEIVEEIPVFLSKTLLNKVFVFQYPIKNVVNCTTNPKIVNCLVKPISQKVKVEFSLNTASRNYDAFKGDQLAIAADGKSQNKNEKPTYLSGTMDKQTLVSTTPLDDINKYIVGIMQDNEIHGSLVKGIVQMRPNFSYFDKLDKRKKAEQNAENTADMDEVELKQVTVKFARTENEKSKKAREKSYDYISQQTADEPWCEALWHDSDTSTAVLEKQKLIVTNNETSERFLSLPSREYIGSLIANDTKKKNFEETLRNSPLLNQIKSLLIEAKALSFNQLMELLPDKTITTEKVLRVLPLAGILIQGNWVPLSEILYPPDTFSEINGVSSELMCRGRDYIMYKLSKSDDSNRLKFSQITQLPMEEVKQIITSVAKLNASKKWELFLEPDLDFEKKNQEIVQRQEVYWKSKLEIFKEMESEKTITKRIRKKSVRDAK